MKPTLFLLLGYPGSGKSTFSRQLAASEDIVRVNSDELRTYMFADTEQIHNPGNNTAVFGALDYVTERLLKANCSVIFDANNNRIKDRAKHERLAADCGAQTVVLWVKTPLEVARLRDKERESIPGYTPIPPKRYDEIVAALQVPIGEEKVIAIDGLVSFEEQLASFRAQMASVEQFDAR